MTSRIYGREARSTFDRLFDSSATDERWVHTSGKLDQLAIPERRGGLDLIDRRALFYLLSNLHSASVLEIGTHIGALTLNIAAALSARNGDDASLVSVDISDVNSPESQPWLVHGTRQSPREMADEMGYGPFVAFITERSLSYMATCTRRFDLIFLDGDHAAGTVYQEITAALTLLNPGGVIVLHDYFPALKPLWSDVPMIPGPYLATERLVREGAPLVVLPFGDLPWRGTRQSNVTSLALLLRRDP